MHFLPFSMDKREQPINQMARYSFHDWNGILDLIWMEFPTHVLQSRLFREGEGMKVVHCVAALIFNESRQVLLVQNANQGNPYWSLPGGYVQTGETLTEAVVRETKEETGLTVSVMNLYSVREVLFQKREHHAIIFTFLAQVTDGELNIEDPDHEVTEAKWVDLETANALMPYLPEKIRDVGAGHLLPSYHFQVTHEF